MTDTPPETKPKRSRGGQPGNNNALKYGFYSRQLSPDVVVDLDENFSVNAADEIALLRAYLRRFIESLPAETDLEKNLVILRTIALASTALNRLLRTYHYAQLQHIKTPRQEEDAVKRLNKYLASRPKFIKYQR